MEDEATPVTEGAKHSQSRPTVKALLERAKSSSGTFFARLRGRLRPTTK